MMLKLQIVMIMFSTLEYDDNVYKCAVFVLIVSVSLFF